MLVPVPQQPVVGIRHRRSVVVELEKTAGRGVGDQDVVPTSQIRRDLHVIFISGYACESQAHRATGQGDAADLATYSVGAGYNADRAGGRAAIAIAQRVGELIRPQGVRRVGNSVTAQAHRAAVGARRADRRDGQRVVGRISRQGDQIAGGQGGGAT